MERLAAVLLAVGLAATALFATEVPLPPAPTRWATDTAGFLKPSTLAALDSRLEGYERATGHQVLVWIGPTTGDTPTEEWTVDAFAKWKVGRKGLDDGLVLFIFPQDHKVRVEVGYGLEDRVPDVIAYRIINDVMVPRIRAGDPDGAVTAGVDALLSAIGGAGAAEASEAPAPRDRRAGQPVALSLFQMVLFALVGIAFLILLVTHPGLALYLLFSILSGGRGGGGGWSGGGGGFSGGGGMSGGGGATGSW